MTLNVHVLTTRFDTFTTVPECISAESLENVVFGNTRKYVQKAEKCTFNMYDTAVSASDLNFDL